MDRTDFLLIALLVVGLGRIAQAHIQHRELIALLNDFATMTGELFPILRKIGGNDD